MGSFSEAAYGQILTSLKNMLITYKALSKESELNITILNFLNKKTGYHLGRGSDKYISLCASYMDTN